MVDRMWRWLLTLSCFVLASAAAQAQPVLVSADVRQAVDLDGPWNWSVDPYRDGLSGFHGGEAAAGHRRYDDIDTTAAMRADPKGLYEYDMDRSPVVQLPQSFVTHSPDMRRYNGLVWYQRRFTVHRQAGRARVPALRGGRLSRLRLRQRQVRRGALGRLHALRLRGDEPAPRRRQSDHCRRGFGAHGRGRAAGGRPTGRITAASRAPSHCSSCRRPTSTMLGCD